MKIITAPNKILSQKAKPVLKINKKIFSIIEQMKIILEKQKDPLGVGLAAPQVGIPLQIFIIKPTKKVEIKAFINPKIINSQTTSLPVRQTGLPAQAGNFLNQKTSPAEKKTINTPLQNTKLEGCLSLPAIWGPVRRANKVLLEYQTIKGEKKTSWFSDFSAVIIQHEMDHLNGVLFTQHVLTQGEMLYQEQEDGEFKPYDL